jgi:prepilin-type N-terminal cleavage/methylation domain-containing protein
MNTKLKNEKGFTIIEVLIVLAIAGLILLIVFLAVPALQRTSRNTARKSDVGRVGSLTTEFVSNNNGRLPLAADNTAIADAAGTLSQYDFSTATGNPANLVVVAGNAAPQGNPSNIDQIVIATGAKCNPNGAASLAGPGSTEPGTVRQLAIMYSVENANGVTPVCQDI